MQTEIPTPVPIPTPAPKLRRTNSKFASQLRRRIRLQKILGFIFFIPICGPLMLSMRYVLGYRVERLREYRKLYADLIAQGKPLLICSNHLTYLDSVILIYAFANHWRYWIHFKTLTWNLPAAEYVRNPFFAVVGFLSKCIFIDRKGGPEYHRTILNICRDLMSAGEPMMIFPEGRRSRTGRFDDRKLALGIGKILMDLDEVTVLCVYQRARDQKGFSGFPALGSHFELRHEILNLKPKELALSFSSNRPGIEAITRQIAKTIQQMEVLHFS